MILPEAADPLLPLQSLLLLLLLLLSAPPPTAELASIDCRLAVLLLLRPALVAGFVEVAGRVPAGAAADCGSFSVLLLTLAALHAAVAWHWVI